MADELCQGYEEGNVTREQRLFVNEMLKKLDGDINDLRYHYYDEADYVNRLDLKKDMKVCNLALVENNKPTKTEIKAKKHEEHHLVDEYVSQLRRIARQVTDGMPRDELASSVELQSIRSLVSSDSVLKIEEASESILSEVDKIE